MSKNAFFAVCITCLFCCKPTCNFGYSQDDIMREIPYQGKVWKVDMTGVLLRIILEAEEYHVTLEADLQMKNILCNPPTITFQLDGELIMSGENYIVALNNYMLARKDYTYLAECTECIVQIYEQDSANESDL